MAKLDFPNTPVEGQVYVAENGVSYQYQGAKWSTQLRSSWANTGSNPGLTPPASPTNGTFWWDSDNGQLYTYYVDANSSQWITASPNTLVDSSGNFVALSSATPTGVLDGVYVLEAEHDPG